MDKEVVISVNNISKKYYTNKGNLLNSTKEEDAFWALKDISFEVKKGEILGIIGLNGAGKSTILKIMADIVPPTSGSIEYKGSILSILDIGTGFHPDLSGYENIFFNASLLGMKKKETEAKLKDIIEFSGIGNFINEPVKNYSNGMYLRLALSIALFTNNEIILLDEVVSVGDAEFRHKAVQKIREQANDGKACIMISHDLTSIMELCDNCILIEKGKIIYSGKSREVVEDYFNTVYNNIQSKTTQLLEHDVCKIIDVRMEKDAFVMDEPITALIKFEVKKSDDVRVVIKARNYNAAILTDSAAYRSKGSENYLETGVYETKCVIPANLFNAGIYFLDVILATGKGLLVEYQMAVKFSVVYASWELNKTWNMNNEIIPFRPICEWETRKTV